LSSRSVLFVNKGIEPLSAPRRCALHRKGNFTKRLWGAAL